MSWTGAGTLLLALLALAAPPAPLAGQAAARGDAAQCGVCHGELELLRQHVPSLTRAQELLVRPAELRASAHGEMPCAECHQGYGRFPHPDAGPVTKSCASCHEEADTAWSAGKHAQKTAEGELAAACASCHGVHDVATKKALEQEKGPALRRVVAECTACHRENALPANDAHARELVACWSCHEPHRTHAVDDPAAAIAPARQAQTCGACHDTVAVAFRGDAHDRAAQKAVAEGKAELDLPAGKQTPVCTACHNGHGVLSPRDSATFVQASVERCGACHEKAMDTFFDTYHGKATVLGSQIAASCSDCHGAHGIFASDHPQSAVHTTQLLETCRGCHPEARPAFTQYDSHPELTNFRRNPILAGSFWFMNGLLLFVLVVFGAHTLLWWVRLIIDRRRGIGHGSGGHAPHGGQGGGSHSHPETPHE